MIRRQSSEGVGYSVVELDGVRHVFAAAVPRRGATLREQAHDALATIRRVLEDEGAPGSMVEQTVFLADADSTGHCHQLMRQFYGRDLPATSYVPQHPCDGKLLAIEAQGIGRGAGEVEIERRGDHLVVARHGGITWVHATQITPLTDAPGVYERTLGGFSAMERVLTDAGVRFDQILRTWLYLGDIVGPEGQTQRYKELNRARSDFYQNYRFLADHAPPAYRGDVFPASTGIGADHRDVLMSCVAMVTDRKDVVLTPLENPQQTSAFCYTTEYGPKSPKFARAIALRFGPCAAIFVSGTASITGSESRHPGDVEAQTRQTLENIEALISEDNLRRHGMPGLGATLADLALARVYVKRREDYSTCRAVCRSMLGEIPTIYAVADICRPELLVEIEGLALARASEAGLTGRARGSPEP
jgi:enamine deaminase RidA (YjgF/YER057c/UK114 family)